MPRAFRPARPVLAALALFLASGPAPAFAQPVPAAVTPVTGEENEPAAPTKPGSEPDSSVEEVLVTGTSVSDAIDQARFTESNVDVLTSEDFKASGDSNVVEALSRVSGVSTVGDKFLVIRGLAERYQSTLFNGFMLPSPDPMRRVLPLDMFPSGALEQIRFEKTFQPYLPADFAGATTQMETRDVPAEREVKFSVGIDANDMTTGKKRQWFKGSSTDWTGFDDGFRSKPRGIEDIDSATPEEVQQLGLATNRRYEIEDKTLPPGFDMAGSYANNWKTPAGKVGVLLSAQGANTWQYRDEVRATQAGYTGVLDANDPRRLTGTTNEVSYSGLGSLQWKPRSSQTVKATVFWSHDTEKRYLVEDPAIDTDQEQAYRSEYAEWEERALLTTELTGSHELDLLPDLLLDWGLSWSQANRTLPDAREYIFRYSGVDYVDGEPEVVDPLRFLSPASNYRRWEDLIDDVVDVHTDAELPLRLLEKFQPTMKSGLKYFLRKRESTAYTYEFNGGKVWNTTDLEEIFSDPNIRPDTWNLRKTRGDQDSYDGEEQVIASYLQSELRLLDRLTLTAGSRFEAYKLTADDRSPNPGGEIKDETFYPAVLATVDLREDLKARASWSRTVNRPDMREFAPARFRNPEDRYFYDGNPNLVVAELMNYDASIEWYHGDRDRIELAGFYKDISDPIQIYTDPTDFNVRTYRNAAEAWLWGLELDVTQSLAPLGRWADDFSVKTNAAYLESEATDPSDYPVKNLKRPLQGQPQFTFNFMLRHEYLPWELDNSLSFQLFGESLVASGACPPGASSKDQCTDDRYDQMHNSLDYLLRKRFQMFGEEFVFTFQGRNLLNAKREETRGNVDERSYREGRDFSVQVGYSF